MANFLKKILDGIKIARFIRLVKSDSESFNDAAPDVYAIRVINVILKRKDELPACLKEKEITEVATEILLELSSLSLSEIEGIVRRHLK